MSGTITLAMLACWSKFNVPHSYRSKRLLLLLFFHLRFPFFRLTLLGLTYLLSAVVAFVGIIEKGRIEEG